MKRLTKSYKYFTLKKLMKIVSVIIIVHFVIFYIFLQVWLFQQKPKLDLIKLNLPYVIVHLDLKGAPPKLTYLESLLPILKEYGANGLLVEYEDMFPYDGELNHLRSGHSYNRDELGHFITSATEMGFEVIPLIQTFGHMEFVLKLNKYIELREDSMYSDSICPSQEKSLKILRTMINQVMDFHSEFSRIKYIHIGCDEVYRINTCSLCKDRNMTKEDLFLHHVVKMSSSIQEMNPNVKVLIWDDMLRHIKPKTLQKYDLQNYVEPVYWDYRPNIAQVSHANLYKYYLTFNNSLWIASAFKGADGNEAVLPDLVNRFRNHYAWMKFIKGYNFGGDLTVSFKGIFLTGWSRYSHFENLCELLPSSIHSLVLNLLVVNECKNDTKALSTIDDYERFFKNMESKLRNNLHCDTNVDLNSFDSYRCFYNERKIYTVLQDYLGNLTQFESDCEIDAISKTLAKNKELNRDVILKVNKKYDLFTQCLKSLLSFEEELTETLKLYYDKFVIKEYISYKIEIHKNRILEKFKYIENNVKKIKHKLFTVTEF